MITAAHKLNIMFTANWTPNEQRPGVRDKCAERDECIDSSWLQTGNVCEPSKDVKDPTQPVKPESFYKVHHSTSPSNYYTLQGSKVSSRNVGYIRNTVENGQSATKEG